VILAAAIGWSLQRFAGLQDAAIFGLLLGFVIAPLVPQAAKRDV
jgi:hypothetical protein